MAKSYRGIYVLSVCGKIAQKFSPPTNLCLWLTKLTKSRSDMGLIIIKPYN